MGVPFMKLSPEFEWDSSPNPNPDLFTIQKKKKLGVYHLLWVHYAGCTNYEGNKILLFKSDRDIDWGSIHCLDPHFNDNSEDFKLLARFVPTEEGWNMGEQFIVIQTSVANLRKKLLENTEHNNTIKG